MEILYYIDFDNSCFGPYGLEEMRALGLLSDVRVYSTATNSWAAASSYSELAGDLFEIRNDSPAEGESQENPGKDKDSKDVTQGQENTPAPDERQSRNSLEEKRKPAADNLKPDCTIELHAKYDRFEEEICSIIRKDIITPEGIDAQYKKVFPSPETERTYYLEEYRRCVNSLTAVLNEIAGRTKEIQYLFENDMLLLEEKYRSAHGKFVSEREEEALELLKSVENQLNVSSDNELASESLKQYRNNRQAEIAEKYKSLEDGEMRKLEAGRKEARTSFDRMKRHIIGQINRAYREIDGYFSSYFNKFYETSSLDLELWNKIEDRGALPPSELLAGRKRHEYGILDENIVVVENDYVGLLNRQNLIITYDNGTKRQALKVVNSLLGRLLASSSPGKVSLTMIDSDEMDGTCDMFKYLNRTIFQILVRPEEICRCLNEKEQLIENIVQNLLLGPIKSLLDYNQVKENKEPYHVIVVEDFPAGINNEALYRLQKIMKNGVRAGISVALLINKDKINYSDDTQKSYRNLHLEQLETTCTVFDFTKEDFRARFNCEPFTDKRLQEIVQYINSGVEIRQEDTVLFADYVLPESKWWERRSAKYIEIPFGISRDKQIQRLKITQESGQNSAVVIGIPGSGKSVFLHTLICNAATIYSPDELNLYLIDFSGVEFNSYALHNLPHARVIAPEAEREFGLSILNELVEEGARRMELCRNNDVSNIVDLKAKNPSLPIPRLLVIIDEFQKLFEIENDIISRDANAKIHIIIQEFRKFGINLILATQKLPSSSILPKDLIANRIVFKSSPADFSALISLQSNVKVPLLRTGECIYNSESGSPYDNHRAQGFLITQANISLLLEQISRYEKSRQYARRYEMRTFRYDELPEFQNRRVDPVLPGPCDIPDRVGIYFGESISINATDVHAVLRKESGNNILVIGGEASVAQRITYYAALSATTAHSDRSATFLSLNFMRREEMLNGEIASMFEALPFDSSIISGQTDIAESLSAAKEEIEARRQDEERPQNHIYITIYAFHLARIFDKGGRYGDSLSECGLLLDYIIKNGPAVGVFTILQCDNYENLSRLGNPLSSFAYRIALQMTENDSNKIVGSSIANKLFVFNRRQTSVFRAYFRDNNRNITIKFKPYQ